MPTYRHNRAVDRVFPSWSSKCNACSAFVTANLSGNHCRASGYQIDEMAKHHRPHEPACMIAHGMINKFADIIGHCDLLGEIVEPNSEVSRRVNTIREVARECVAELREHERKAKAG